MAKLADKHTTKIKEERERASEGAPSEEDERRERDEGSTKIRGEEGAAGRMKRKRERGFKNGAGCIANLRDSDFGADSIGEGRSAD